MNNHRYCFHIISYQKLNLSKGPFIIKSVTLSRTSQLIIPGGLLQAKAHMNKLCIATLFRNPPPTMSTFFYTYSTILPIVTCLLFSYLVDRKRYHCDKKLQTRRRNTHTHQRAVVRLWARLPDNN